MGNLLAAIETDRTKRKARAARDAERPLIFARNRCIAVLAELEPDQALRVVLGIQKSLIEFIQAEATGYVRAGKSY